MRVFTKLNFLALDTAMEQRNYGELTASSRRALIISDRDGVKTVIIHQQIPKISQKWKWHRVLFIHAVQWR